MVLAIIVMVGVFGVGLYSFLNPVKMLRYSDRRRISGEANYTYKAIITTKISGIVTMVLSVAAIVMFIIGLIKYS